MERREVIDLVKEINLFYGTRGKTLEQIQKQINDWEPVLVSMDSDTVKANFQRHLQESSFPPNLSDLLRVAKVKEEEPPRTVPTVEETHEMLDRYSEPPGTTWEEVEAELIKLRRIVGIDHE